MNEKRQSHKQHASGNQQTTLEKDWAELIQRFNILHNTVNFELNLDTQIKVAYMTKIANQLKVLNTQSPSKNVCKSAKRKLENIKKELGLSNNTQSR